MKIKGLVSVAFALGLAVTGASAIAQKNASEKDFSGWLKSYDSLVYNEDRQAFIFFNEDKRGQYQKIMIDEVEVWGAKVDKEPAMAEQASAYMQAGMEKILADKGIGATEAGPGVLRARVAITGVEKTKESLKAHNVIPVSAVFRLGKEATGKVATFIDTMFEAEFVDSVSGEQVAATVNKTIGDTEKRSGDELTFDDVKPVLDGWLERYARTVDEFLAKRAG